MAPQAGGNHFGNEDDYHKILDKLGKAAIENSCLIITVILLSLCFPYLNVLTDPVLKRLYRYDAPCISIQCSH